MEGYPYRGKPPKPDINCIPEREGMTQRVIRDLWAQAQEDGKTFTVSCSFLQIYNEKVFDLLNLSKSTEGLRI